MSDDAVPEGIVHNLLRELDFPVSRFRDEHHEMQRQFEEAAEPLARLLVGARPAPGHVGFALNQMLVRGLSDLVVAFHLALHGYLNQAYNEMRIAYEACDIISLVAQDPADATRWIESETPWAEFSPGKIRKKLQKPKFDEVYSHLCAMAHPRFSGANLTGYMVKKPSGDTSSMLSLGPAPLTDERPFVGHAALFVGLTLGRVAVQSGRLVSAGGVEEKTWIEMMTEHRTALCEFLRLAMQLVAATGQREAADQIEALVEPFLNPLDEISSPDENDARHD